MIRRRREDELAPADYLWNPYSADPLGILDEMDRLFEDFRSGFENSLAMPREAGGQALRTPAMDLIDGGKEYELRIEMPGIAKEDINIEVGEKEVRISAETKEEGGDKDSEGGYIRRERRYSRIFRQVPLPEPVRSDRTSAEMKDGLLVVRLPKVSAPEKRSRKVEVR
jgi:HSP20 family protein